MKTKIIVSKFGGTSMGDYAAMMNAATISKERTSSIVCVSATSGTTDKLIQIAKTAATGNMPECEKLIFQMKERHMNLLEQVPAHGSESGNILLAYFTELELLAQGLTLLKELTPRAYDLILSFGERMSSVIFTEVVKSQLPGKDVQLLDARTIIRTDSNFGRATPQIELISTAARMLKLDGNTVYVTQGFIGSDSDGHTTILGRGGSDYSAALFAEGVEADVLEIWTDVAGIATTDPRIVPEAKIISELSYAEAGEMAQYGAKILHPATIAPAVRKNIPVFVGSTFAKDAAGTWIRASAEHKPAVRAITKRSDQALLTITTPVMLNAYGFMSEIFGVFGRHRVSVDCVTTSEISVAVTVDKVVLDNEKFVRDLETVGKVNVETGYALISLIGNDLYNRSNLAKTIFSNIEEMNVRMMSLGASPYNFNFLVKEADAKTCIQTLHQNLIG